MNRLILFLFTGLFVLSNVRAENPGMEADTNKIYKIPSITVTSTTMGGGKQQVPVSEIQRSEIQKSYTMKDFPQFLNRMTSIVTYSQNGDGIGYSNMVMRGFDQRRISVMINGIPQNDPEDHNVYWVDIPDIAESIENVQIQRGAGLNIYGSPAIGGSINLQTSNFVNDRFVRISGGLGLQSFGNEDIVKANSGKLLFEFSSGFVDNYSFYGRISRISTNGYRDRSFADLTSYFLSAVRFDESLTTQINIFNGEISDGLVYNGLPRDWMKDKSLRRNNLSYWVYDSTGSNLIQDYITPRREQEQEEFNQPHFEILNDWTITPNISFKSALFYYIGKGYYDYDASWADTSMLRLTAENGYYPTENPRNSLFRGSVDNQQWGWIPRIQIDHGNGNLTLGLELRIHRSNHFGTINYAENLPAGYDPDYQVYSYDGIRNIFSVFAREEFPLDEKTNLTLEAQFVSQLYSIDDEKAGYNYTSYKSVDGSTKGNGGAIFEQNYYFFNPKVGLSHNISEQTSIYFLTAFTSREPRMRNLYAAEDSYFGAVPLFEAKLDENGTAVFDFSKPLVKPESMLDIELGINHNFEQGQLDVNLYWMEYFDELVKSGRLDIFGNPVDQNAPKTRHYGFEIMYRGPFIPKNEIINIDFMANMTWSINELIEYDFDTGSEMVSLAGNNIAGFPSLLMNFGLSAEWKSLELSFLGKFVGQSYTDNFGNLITESAAIKGYLSNQLSGYYSNNILPSYFVMDAEIAYTLTGIPGVKNIRLRLGSDNIFNALYAAGAEGKDFFPAAERNFFMVFNLEF